MSCRDSEYFGNFRSFVTSQPLLPHWRGPGCYWPTSSSQSELRRVLLAAVMLMKFSHLPHWAVHHPSPGTDVHDVTSQAERPSARGRLLGYFCRRWEQAYTHKHRLLEFLLIKGKHKTFSEVTAKKKKPRIMEILGRLWRSFLILLPGSITLKPKPSDQEIIQIWVSLLSRVHLYV